MNVSGMRTRASTAEFRFAQRLIKMKFVYIGSRYCATSPACLEFGLLAHFSQLEWEYATATAATNGFKLEVKI